MANNTFLAALALMPALSACDWQTSWSTEYHLRQFEEWRIIGDRSRANGKFASAKGYYQKALDELEQSGAKAFQKAEGMEDVAEAELLAEEYQSALSDFEKARKFYAAAKVLSPAKPSWSSSQPGSQQSSPSSSQQSSPSKSKESSSSDSQPSPLSSTQASSQPGSRARSAIRCLTGYAVTCFKLHKSDEAEKNLDDAQSYFPLSISTVPSAHGASPEALICGWTPVLCQHSIRYWRMLSDTNTSPSKLSENLKDLLTDHSVCRSVKRLAAESRSQILREEHEDHAARILEEAYGLSGNVDTPAASEAQMQWELSSKKGKRLEEQGDIPGAIAAYSKAIDISAIRKDDCAIRYLASLYNLAFCYLTRDEWAQALPVLKECLALQQSRFGDGDRGVALPLIRLGRTNLAVGRMGEAKLEIEKGYSMALANYGAESPFTARAECSLADLKIYDKQFEQARKLLEHALSILNKEPQRNERVILGAMFGIAQIYESTNKHEECLKAASDAATFATENGSYVEQIQALKKMIAYAIKFREPKMVQDAQARVLTILSEASSNAKWQTWAAKQLSGLNASKIHREARLKEPVTP